MFRGVLFDFDNTLVNSSKVLPRAQMRVAELVANYLGRPDKVGEVFNVIQRVERVVEMHGVYDRDRFWVHVLEELGVSDGVGDDVVMAWTKAYWDEYMKHEPFPDTVYVLESLKSRCRLGMVTNTDGLPGMKMRRLERMGLLRYFEAVVVAGEGGVRPKPSPQPFTVAVKTLGLSPDECLMVGDHPINDVVGAKAAGLHAALLGLKPYAVKPDYVITRLEDVVKIVLGKSF